MALSMEQLMPLAEASPLLGLVECELRDTGKENQANDLVKLQQDAGIKIAKLFGHYDTSAGSETAKLDKVYEERALPYFKHFVRHILFVREKYFVIYDDLACDRPAEYTWLYHILPDAPIAFDPAKFTVDYTVGDVKVRLRHIAHPDKLRLDNRKGLDAFVNPITGEDYRSKRKGDILCGYNLWISNAKPAKKWNYLAVVYPLEPGISVFPTIERLDDHTVRVGEDVISFNPKSASGRGAAFVVDVEAMRPTGRKIK